MYMYHILWQENIEGKYYYMGHKKHKTQEAQSKRSTNA